jgi:hypothetical protein
MLCLTSNRRFVSIVLEKLANRGASKIPQMSHIGDFSHRKALQNRYERLQSFSR